MKHVLTIAGHDLSNGAGITKDLEIFSSLGMHGLSVPSAFVVQGPTGATSVEAVPLSVFSSMLDSVEASFRLSGVKVGVLPDAAHVAMVAEFLASKRLPFVLDPVIAAKNGLRLITDEGIAALVGRLLPLKPLITPNIDEAQALAGMAIGDMEGMRRAARAIQAKGPKQVLIKGGHLAGAPTDLLFDGEEEAAYGRGRAEKRVHGTGCLLSSALLAYIAMGYPAAEAFFEAERLMDRLLSDAYQPAEGGYHYADPGCLASRDGERWAVLQAMNEAAARLSELDVADLVPAVQMNMGYALRGAVTPMEVAAFPGRIGTRQGRLYFKGAPEFGASSHVARLCLTYMRRHPHVRAAVDLRYDGRTLERAREKGLSAVFWDRKNEPEGVRAKEGRSLDFLVEAALDEAKGAPDIIYDHGDVGKEPIIRLFARDPQELLNKMEMVRWKTS